MRTNVVIDDQLMSKALKASGYRTKKSAIEAGLRLLTPEAARISAAIEGADPLGRGSRGDEAGLAWSSSIPPQDRVFSRRSAGGGSEKSRPACGKRMWRSET
ncbi:MAG: type II toxin-antitoxin system VapB family antitoxin [Kiritimatiellia bacterium]